MTKVYVNIDDGVVNSYNYVKVKGEYYIHQDHVEKLKTQIKDLELKVAMISENAMKNAYKVKELKRGSRC